MREALSRLRFRKVRSHAQQAGRRRGARAFRDSDALCIIAGLAAWGLGLWLVAPAGVPDWRMILACVWMPWTDGQGSILPVMLARMRAMPTTA